MLEAIYVIRLDQIDSSLSPSSPKWPELVNRETLGHLVWYVVGHGDILEAKLSWSYTVPNEVIPKFDMFGGIVMNRMTIIVDN